MTGNTVVTTMDASLDKRARDYLRMPYSRIVLPEEDGTWRGEISEFSGCIASGETQALALQALEDTAHSWLCSALEHGYDVPTPYSQPEYSGRFVLRLPRSMHRKAAFMAEREGVSLNQLIANFVAEAIGERQARNPPNRS